MAETAAQSAPTPASEPLAALPDSDDSFSESGDSALGSSETNSSYTASITSSITAYQQENGRRYHAYQAGRYVLPNDEQEQERLDLQYHAFRLAYGDQTHFAPISDNVKTILDIGTGTGIWVIDIADRYPDAQIVGTDLSPIQPQWVPPNVRVGENNKRGERGSLALVVRSRRCRAAMDVSRKSLRPRPRSHPGRLSTTLGPLLRASFQVNLHPSSPFPPDSFIDAAADTSNPAAGSNPKKCPSSP